jgi:hypothetical protein
MKEFLLLIREDQGYGDLSFADMQADIEKHIAWVNEIAEKGHFKYGNPLESKGKLIKGKEKIVTDGPYIETKECVSGFYFLLANDLDEATAIASGCPSLEYGAQLEIREVIPTDE